MRTWRERTACAQLDGIRWHLLPAAARAAMLVLRARQWAVIRERLQGATCAEIALKEGLSRQAIHSVERTALANLARAAGRKEAPSVDTIVHATREAPAASVTKEEARGLTGHAGGLPQDELDKLADAFIAEAERGPVSTARRAWYDRRARQLAE